MDPLETLLTTDDLANYLKVDVVTVRRLVNRGELAAYRIGGEYRFKARDVRDYLERQYVPAQLFAAGDLDKFSKQAFDKFTKRVKQTMLLAAEEARNFKRAQVGPEHILLGLIREGEGVAGRVLDELGIKFDRAVQAVEATSGVSNEIDQPVQDPDDTAEQVIGLAVVEAKQLKHHFIGTEHLLLALTHDPEGNAMRALAQLGVTAEQVREAVLRMLKQGPR
jgi:excisionase family DNA binding protein